MKTARFWTWWNDGFVKITVTPQHTEDHPLVLSCGGATDEGWHSHTELYWLDPDTDEVRCQMINDGRDCDGRLTNSNHFVARRDRLYEVEPHTESQGVRTPFWERIGGSRYDEYAQAAGY